MFISINKVFWRKFYPYNLLQFNTTSFLIFFIKTQKSVENFSLHFFSFQIKLKARSYNCESDKLKVFPLFMSPVVRPSLSHFIRWSLVPCVNDSGLKPPVAFFWR